MSPLQATDCSFVDKCHQQHDKNPHYQKPKRRMPQFAVNHYAGTVWYNVSPSLKDATCWQRIHTHAQTYMLHLGWY